MGVGAVLLGAAVLRVGLTDALLPNHPQAAAAVWPGHPQVRIQQGLTKIGEAAAKGQAPSADAIAEVGGSLAAAPLATAPFLVAGTQAVASGRAAAAEHDFAEVRRRDPRNVAARYFLAQHYLSGGRDLDGLRELAALARLLPNADALIGPAISAYLRQGHDPARVRSVLASDPALKEQVLATLAANADNAKLVLALAGTPAPNRPVPGWVQTLAQAMIDKEQAAAAYTVWSGLSGVRAPAGGLYNAGFADKRSPPPFNWSIPTSDAGLAEPGSGGLNIVYYGRSDATLASQHLLLSPGRYRLAMSVDGNPQGALSWTLTCVASKAVLGSLPLRSGPVAGSFVVPAQNCPVQRLELVGRMQDSSQTLSATVSRLQLGREG
ncbi:hypothetical protein [Sphingomonas ginkgonis]|uniref:hypothetical protein n=1 Tax=Sphingomonas ginkgonis TaxID=2315330 RepID=UPI00163A01A4|nr:hypothetical protein [Sphingomonas ginkgonis]